MYSWRRKYVYMTENEEELKEELLSSEDAIEKFYGDKIQPGTLKLDWSLPGGKYTAKNLEGEDIYFDMGRHHFRVFRIEDWYDHVKKVKGLPIASSEYRQLEDEFNKKILDHVMFGFPGKQPEMEETLTEGEEDDPQELMVGSYQTKYFDMCPGATGVYTDIEDKVEDMDMAERAAKLQDALFALEKHILNDEESGTDEGYMLMAQNLADQIMSMAKMMGLEDEHSYIDMHVKTIEKALKGEDTESTADQLDEDKSGYANALSRLQKDIPEVVKAWRKSIEKEIEDNGTGKYMNWTESDFLVDYAEFKDKWMDEQTKTQIAHDEETYRRETGGMLDLYEKYLK
jgi:hypothetical protein